MELVQLAFLEISFTPRLQPGDYLGFENLLKRFNGLLPGLKFNLGAEKPLKRFRVL